METIEDQLEEVTEQREEARKKVNYLANENYDLRTELNSIKAEHQRTLLEYKTKYKTFILKNAERNHQTNRLIASLGDAIATIEEYKKANPTSEAVF